VHTIEAESPHRLRLLMRSELQSHLVLHLMHVCINTKINVSFMVVTVLRHVIVMFMACFYVHQHKIVHRAQLLWSALLLLLLLLHSALSTIPLALNNGAGNCA